MSHSTGSRTPFLSTRHRDELKASGLTDDTIRAAGFETLGDGPTLNALLNRNDAAAFGASLLIPYFGPAGERVPHPEYVRLKPGKPPTVGHKPAKYLSPSRKPVRLYYPPNFAELLARAVDNPGRPVVIT